MSEEIKNNVSENSENISTVTETARATPEITETPAFEPAPLSATSNKNMIKCKTCGTEIAKSAKACPSCGAKNKKPIYKRVWFWAVIVILFLIILSNIGGNDNKDSSSSGLRVSVGTPVINGTTTAPKETTTKSDPKATLAEARKLLENGNAIGAFDLANTLEKTDEVNAFLEECRKPILAEFDDKVYWKGDDMSDWHWAYANGTESGLDTFSFKGYISQSNTDESAVYFHLYTGFIRSVSNNWIFPETIRIKGEGGTMDIPVSYNERKSEVDNGKLYEWMDLDLDHSEASALSLLLLSSDTVKVRYTGDTYHIDRELSKEQIDHLIIILGYYTMLKHVY